MLRPKDSNPRFQDLLEHLLRPRELTLSFQYSGKVVLRRKRVGVLWAKESNPRLQDLVAGPRHEVRRLVLRTAGNHKSDLRNALHHLGQPLSWIFRRRHCVKASQVGNQKNHLAGQCSQEESDHLARGDEQLAGETLVAPPEDLPERRDRLLEAQSQREQRGPASAFDSQADGGKQRFQELFPGLSLLLPPLLNLKLEIFREAHLLVIALEVDLQDLLHLMTVLAQPVRGGLEQIATTDPGLARQEHHRRTAREGGGQLDHMLPLALFARPQVDNVSLMRQKRERYRAAGSMMNLSYDLELRRLRTMRKSFTLEYWLDEDWHVGRLKEVPSVFSQGESLPELEENIQDAYRLMMDADPLPVRNESQKPT